ncbi:hypothetical protein [Chryseobacterium rhizoplanae]|uniref:hypothetical protein n=1 Tax=Chryseobacterium rhizoplanae TaxID=1609531 RepID=UPI00115B5DEF|nr:hypothetical protein [Chryseobacterium rhizoplanae]
MNKFHKFASLFESAKIRLLIESLEFGVGEFENRRVNGEWSICWACEFFSGYEMRDGRFGVWGLWLRLKLGIHLSLCEVKIDLLMVSLFPLDFNL